MKTPKHSDEVSSHLLKAPLLNVKPELAVLIGLNEAIVLQQIAYLFSVPKNGKRINGKRWIFNTYEQWQAQYFPFWKPRLIRCIFKSLEKSGYLKSCQPEGRRSRRKYYRITEAAESATSKRQKSALPTTETTSSENTRRTVVPALGGDARVSFEIPSFECFESYINEHCPNISNFKDARQLYDAWDAAGWEHPAGNPIRYWERALDALENTLEAKRTGE